MRAHRAILTTSLLLCASCGQGESHDGSVPPVFLIGMDGLEWDVMTPLLEAGRLPHFQAMIDRGVAGGLATFQPTFSPVVWTSMATGVTAAEHGVLNFSEEENGRLKQGGLPYTSNSRKVPALWNIASEFDRSVLSVGWWVSWPAEPVNGRIMASYAAQAQGQVFWKAGVWVDGLPEMTYPEDLIYDVIPLLQNGSPTGPLREGYNDYFSVIPGEPRKSAADVDLWEFPRVRDSFFRIGYHGDRTHLEIFKQELGKEVADLNMVYFGLPDVAGHFWWRYYQPDEFNYAIPQEHRDLLQKRLDAAYTAADEWLGQIVASAPENARFMIVSDHGMHASNRNNPNHPQSGAHEDAPPGVFIAAGPGIAKRGMLPEVEWKFPVRMGNRRYENVLQAPQRIGSVYDVTPTVLHWLGIPSAADMSGAPLLDLAATGDSIATAIAAVATHSKGFRAASTPRVPKDGLDEQFQEAFLDALGYRDVAESEAARAQDFKPDKQD
jgi:Type I phosphodiesterase / nucleotide pyrophosphatase